MQTPPSRTKLKGVGRVEQNKFLHLIWKNIEKHKRIVELWSVYEIFYEIKLELAFNSDFVSTNHGKM